MVRSHVSSTLRYATAIELRPAYTEALINLAALHHRYGSVPEAVSRYNAALDSLSGDSAELSIMIHNNLGVAEVQVGSSDSLILTRLYSLVTSTTP